MKDKLKAVSAIKKKLKVARSMPSLKKLKSAKDVPMGELKSAKSLSKLPQSTAKQINWGNIKSEKKKENTGKKGVIMGEKVDFYWESEDHKKSKKKK